MSGIRKGVQPKNTDSRCFTQISVCVYLYMCMLCVDIGMGMWFKKFASLPFSFRLTPLHSTLEEGFTKLKPCGLPCMCKCVCKCNVYNLCLSTFEQRNGDFDIPCEHYGPHSVLSICGLKYCLCLQNKYRLVAGRASCHKILSHIISVRVLACMKNQALDEWTKSMSV